MSLNLKLEIVRNGSKKRESGKAAPSPPTFSPSTIVMTALFHDVHDEISGEEKVKGIDFSEILYADDTLIVGKNGRDVTKIFRKVDGKSERYGMTSNKSKC